MSTANKLPPIREDAAQMLDAVVLHLSILDDLRAIAARQDGVLPATFECIIDGGESVQLLGINARLYEHAQKDRRVYEIAVKFDEERMPIMHELERLEGMDAPLMERVERTADLLKVYARALSALASNRGKQEMSARLIVAASLLLALAGAAHAQSRAYRRSGAITATEFQFSPVTVFRDGRGKAIGTSTTFSNGVTIFRSR